MGRFKLVLWCEVVWCVILNVGVIQNAQSQVAGPPFLNSLAVLFRARPPWPTTFPSGTLYAANTVASPQHSLPPTILANNAPKQGILIARPMRPENNVIVPNKDVNKHANLIASQILNSIQQQNAPKVEQSVQGQSPQPAIVVLPVPPSPLPPQVQFPPLPHQTYVLQQNNNQNYPGEIMGMKPGPGPGGLVMISPPNLQLYPPPTTVQQNQHVVTMPMNHIMNGHSGGLGQHHSNPQNELLVVTPSSTVTLGNSRLPDPPTPPKFQSFGDAGNGVMKPVMEKPKDGGTGWTSSKFDSDYFDINMNGIVSNVNAPVVDQSTSQTSTVSSSIRVESNNKDGSSKSSRPLEEGNSINALINSFHQQQQQQQTENSRKLKSTGAPKDFRPSPQLHSFEEPTTGLKSYITFHPSPNSTAPKAGRLLSGFRASDARPYPYYESGFRPIPFNHFAFLSTKVGANTKVGLGGGTKNYFDSWTTTVPPGTSRRNDRKMNVPIVPSPADPSEDEEEMSTSFDDSVNSLKGGRQVTTSSSEVVEDWVSPADGSSMNDKLHRKHTAGKKSSLRKHLKPLDCDKFHRFGFCPITSHYPTDQVEQIASRCSALLSHLIAPLPKTDVRYDIIVSKNGSLLKGRSSRESGWSWKSFPGKPVCDTKEIKIVPGWAKNEQGEWLVILQTSVWKQEAQISLCTPQGATCVGDHCKDDNGQVVKTKCVQRFTAQRLAVLDPEEADRCPVVRSVFLPSACVCLTDPENGEGRHYSNDNNSEDKRHMTILTNSKYSLIANSRNKGLPLHYKVIERSHKKYKKGKLPIEESSEESDPLQTSDTEFIPVISVPNPNSNNTTFMIITEKFTTNESSSVSSSESGGDPLPSSLFSNSTGSGPPP